MSEKKQGLTQLNKREVTIINSSLQMSGEGRRGYDYDELMNVIDIKKAIEHLIERDKEGNIKEFKDGAIDLTVEQKAKVRGYIKEVKRLAEAAEEVKSTYEKLG